MSVEILESYLVSLGAKIDEPSFVRFEGVMHKAGQVAQSSVSGILGDFLKFQIGVTAAFTAVGFGVIGFLDKLAMSDQQMRLFALRSFMTIQQARSVQTALHTLDATVDDVSWDTELHKRFSILIQDQRELSAMLGPQYERQMMDIRDVWFQLQRLEVKGEYFGMKFASDLLSKLGFGDGGILHQLERLNDFVLKNMPQWADELSTDILPILKDFWGILKDLGGLAGELGLEFTNLVGVLSGDSALEGTTFNFHKFAGAVEKVAHWMAVLVHYLVRAEEIAVRFAPVIAGFMGGGALGGGIGTIAGGIAGIPGGPLGVAAGALAGGATGTAIGSGTGAGIGGLVMAFEEWQRYHSGGASGPTPGPSISSMAGGDFDKVVAAVARVESGGRQFDRNGNLITSNKGALGMMQLMPQTAAGLGVDPRDAAQNLAGGKMLLSTLIAKYKNWDNALAAYNWGSGNVDRALAEHRAFPKEVQAYAKNVESKAGITFGDIIVHVPATAHSPAEIAAAVRTGVRSGIEDHTQRLGLETAGAYQ